MTTINKKHKNLRKFVLFLAFALSSFSFACESAEKVEIKATPAPTPEKKRDEFQDAFKSVEVGGFDYIFVFRRPDNEPLTSEDKTYLKANSPADTNRWNLTEEGKIAIAGSNYRFTSKNLAALRKRFVVENRSKVQDEETDENINVSNVNSNRAKKSNK